MKSYCFLNIMFFTILMISPYCTAKTDEIDPIEYQVYKAVIEKEYLKQPGYIDMINRKEKEPLPKTIIIINQTISGATIDEPFDQVFNKIEGDYPSFPQNALKSWIIKNKNQYTLNDNFKFTVKHFLISEKQREESFLPTKWWDSFYKHYPNALGYFNLSRVGFDIDKKAAIVFVENLQDGKWGSGDFWLLKKEKGEWVCFKRVYVYGI
jgi:hypothetical protein